MPTLTQFLLIAFLFWVTPLTATLKMALAYGCFKWLTLGLSPRTISNARQQARLFGGWGVGWAIAIQNLEELKHGAYQAFLIHAGFNIVLIGLLAYLGGRLWYQYKQPAAMPVTDRLASQPTTAGFKPLTTIVYAVLLLVLLLFKTGFAQFQLAQLYASGYLLTQNESKAGFWYQKSAERGYGAAALQGQ